MKQTEALKLALDCVSTLANARDWVGCTPNERWDEDEMYAELCNATICLKKSLSIIQEALAEMDAKREFVGLTDEAISNIWCKVSNTDFVTVDTHEFARAIEAKLREKDA